MEEAEKALSGNMCSSMHRLKDLDGSLGGYFVFPDLYASREGSFRLKFTLYEMEGYCVFRNVIYYEGNDDAHTSWQTKQAGLSRNDGEYRHSARLCSLKRIPSLFGQEFSRDGRVYCSVPTLC